MNKYNIPVITDVLELRKNKEGIRKNKECIRKGKSVKYGNYYYRYIRESDNTENLNMIIYGIKLVIKQPYI